jgi:hypothetical protein
VTVSLRYVESAGAKHGRNRRGRIVRVLSSFLRKLGLQPLKNASLYSISIQANS